MSRFQELIALRKIFADREGTSDADLTQSLAAVGIDPGKVETLLTVLSRSRRGKDASRTQHWQPMETAPKDGTRILLLRENAHFGLIIVVGQWKEDRGEPFWSHDAIGQFGITDARKFQPTHWMPLPGIPARPLLDRHSIDDLNHVGHLKSFGRHRRLESS